MSIKRAATFTNTEDNINLIADELCPGILIESIEGIYAFTGEVKTSPYSQTHGDRYKASRVLKRNIVVIGKIFDDFWNNRQLLYRVFRPGSLGQFKYTEPDRSDRFADYYVEACDIDQDPFRGQYQISLICPDPFFYAKDPEHVDLASWLSDFEFIHEFIAEGEEIGHRETSMIKEVQNLNGVDGIVTFASRPDSPVSGKVEFFNCRSHGNARSALHLANHEPRSWKCSFAGCEFDGRGGKSPAVAFGNSQISEDFAGVLFAACKVYSDEKDLVCKYSGMTGTGVTDVSGVWTVR